MSEVAKIRAMIDQEIAAMNLAMRGYTVTARHDIINNKYASLETYKQELTLYLGEQEAFEVIINALDNLDIDRPPQQC